MSNSLTFCTSSSSAAGGRAPAWLNTSLPFLNAISVGIERMSAAAASCCSASVSTFAYTTSGCSSDEAANVGAKALHGPHHDAQKSTSTISLSVMVSLNSSAVMSCVLTSLLTSGSTCLFPSCGSRGPSVQPAQAHRFAACLPMFGVPCNVFGDPAIPRAARPSQLSATAFEEFADGAGQLVDVGR